MEERRNGTRIRFGDARIEMSHGAGGLASRRLVEGLIVPLLDNATLRKLEDSAVVQVGGERVAVTTDSFVVSPLRFPGGSIGRLAVHGTLNDLAVAGARPMALLATFIVEAGLATETLRAEVEDMAAAASAAGVAVVGGDTKVVEHGKADGLFVTTTGLGLVDERVSLDAASVELGDVVLLSGPIGDHGITVMLARGELDLDAELQSDTRSVYPLVSAVVKAAAPGLRWLRDPTRGGVASALNELARSAGCEVVIRDEAIPVRDAVRGACEILGLEPLHIANEGQFLAVVDPAFADTALAALRQTPGGEEAVAIGEIRRGEYASVVSTTSYGGSRIVDMLVGDPLPRIC